MNPAGHWDRGAHCGGVDVMYHKGAGCVLAYNHGQHCLSIVTTKNLLRVKDCRRVSIQYVVTLIPSTASS